MLTLLGSLIGFGTSFLPEILSFFREKRDQKHELAIMDKQLEHAKVLNDQKMQMLEAEADTRESEALYRQASTRSGVRWVDGLRGSVRPVITYLFMLTFMAVETCLVIAAMRSGAHLSDAILVVWDEQTQAMFATILSFWFGGRQYRKIMGAR